jgi:hypothetical protein
MNLRELNYSRYFLVVSDGTHFPLQALNAAACFAQGFDKGLCLLVWNETQTEAFAAQWQTFAANLTCPTQTGCYTGIYSDLIALTERTETPMVFFEVAKKSLFNKVMPIFKGLRELRIPFILLKDTMQVTSFANVAIPVTFLPEEKEKAPYSSNMGRFLHSQLHVITAKDYGSKAQKNTTAITGLYDKFQLSYQVKTGKKDSFKVEKEVVLEAPAKGYDMVIISTSRDYGLDDIILGPKEQHIFNATQVPLMCINPRGDLYVLCW